MTIEQSPDDAAVQNAREGLVVLFSVPHSDYFVAIRKAAHMQPFFVYRAAAEADAVW